jgi:hypothetical protein
MSTGSNTVIEGTEVIEALTAIDAIGIEVGAIESPIASLDRVIVVPLLCAADFCATFAELSGASGATGAIEKVCCLKILGKVTIRPVETRRASLGLDPKSGASAIPPLSRECPTI